LGLHIEKDKLHLWQVCNPLVLERTSLKVRYRENIYDVKAVIVDIPEEYRRDILVGEECTRPRYRNPLSARVIIGENFINRLPEDERKNLIEFGY